MPITFCRRKSFCGSQTVSERAGERGALLAQPSLGKQSGFAAQTGTSPASGMAVEASGLAMEASGEAVEALGGQQRAVGCAGWYLHRTPAALLQPELCTTAASCSAWDAPSQERSGSAAPGRPAGLISRARCPSRARARQRKAGPRKGHRGTWQCRLRGAVCPPAGLCLVLLPAWRELQKLELSMKSGGFSCVCA